MISDTTHAFQQTNALPDPTPGAHAPMNVRCNSDDAPSSSFLHAEALAKAYGPTIAISNVTIDVRPGEIHAVLGENGAGKSTLVKILSGIVTPDEGTLALGGHPFRPRNLLAARQAGVSTAFQELSLLPNLSVAANLAMPHQVKGVLGLTSTRRSAAAAASLLHEFDAETIAPHRLVAHLSLAEKQRLEIIKALSHRPRLLILDEPTAALAEPEWLFRILEQVTADGVGILYISHRLGEIRRLCQRGTILRNGRSIATVTLSGTSDADIFRMMVGESKGRAEPTVAVSSSSPERLTVEGLSGHDVHSVDLAVCKGEIVGVAALEGQGQRTLFRMLAGLVPATGGQVKIDGAAATLRSPAAALRSGIGFLPEERKVDGIFPSLRTAGNISLTMLADVARFGVIDRRREQTMVGEAANGVDLEPRYLRMPVSALSGGNQQKALLARVLASGAPVLALFDPTRGVDVGTKQVIYAAIRKVAAEGGAVLLYSTELSELVELTHRCLAIYRGRVVGELRTDEMSEERLVELASGHGESPK